MLGGITTMAQFSNMGGQQTTPSPKKPSECNKCKANGFPEQYITFLPDIDPMTGKQKANTFTNKPAWIILNYGDRSKHEHRISVEQQHIQPLQQSETEAKQQVTQNIENAMKENSNNQITSSLDNLYSYMENGFKTVEGMQTRLEGIDRQTLVIDGEIEELKT